MKNGYYVDVKEIGATIRKRRDKDLHMTLDQLSELTQLGGKSLLSKYENGQTPRLTVDALLRIADALDCEPDYLVGRIPHPHRTTSEISELIPLSREAIEALEDLGHNLSEYSDYDSALVIDIINDLIINLVQSVSAALEIDLSTLEGGEKYEGYDVKVTKSGVFTDAAKMLIAYEAISDFQSGEPQHATPVEYNYARIAIPGLKANIGNRLSDIVAGTVRKHADPEHHIRKEI